MQEQWYAEEYNKEKPQSASFKRKRESSGLRWEKKLYAKVYSKNESSVCEIVKKEKESSAILLREGPHSYNFYYSIPWLFYFIIIVNLRLCLMYKLNFITDMYV